MNPQTSWVSCAHLIRLLKSGKLPCRKKGNPVLAVAWCTLRPDPALDDTYLLPLMMASVQPAVDVHASEALASRILDGADLDDADVDARLLTDDLLPDWTEDWVLVRREQHTQLRALETLCRRLRLMVRLWAEPGHTTSVRARITQTLDAHAAPRVAFAGSADDICAIVRTWVQEVTSSPDQDAVTTGL